VCFIFINKEKDSLIDILDLSLYDRDHNTVLESLIKPGIELVNE